MPPWLVLAAAGLATFRLTWLVTKDDFPPVRWARTSVVNAKRTPEWLADLVTCGWCASGWISLGLTLLVYLTDWGLGPNLGAYIFWPATWAIGALIWDYWSDREVDRARRDYQD